MRDRPSKYSQAGRILKVLERGEWVSTHDLIYTHRIPGVIHSRISELRRDYGYDGRNGFKIEHRKEGNNGARSHQYRLAVAPSEVGGPRAEGRIVGARYDSPSDGGVAGPTPYDPLGASGVGTAAAPEALTLFGDDRTQYAREAA